MRRLLALTLALSAGLAFAGGIAGTVTEARTGNPIANALVVASNRAGDAGRAQTNEQGQYLIENLEPGQYRVRAEHRGYEPGVYGSAVEVVRGQITRGINIQLRPRQQGTGAISGTVIDRRTNEPIPGALVVARGPQGRGKARTDRQGNYVIRGLAPGRYEVGAKARRYFGQVYPQPVVVVAGQVAENINFALRHTPRRGAIAGQVFDARTGRPIPGALVIARGEESGGRAVTDRQGHYRIPGLFPGDYRVSAMKRGYEPATYPRPVPVVAGEVTRGIDLRLHRRNLDSD